MTMNADDTFSSSDSQHGISLYTISQPSSSPSLAMSHNDSTESFVDIPDPDRHPHPIPRPSSPSSLPMNRTDSTESYVNIPDPGHHPHPIPQPFFSSTSRIDASPHISVDEASLSVDNHARTTNMDYCDGSKAIGSKFTPKQVRDILYNSTFFIPEEVSTWHRYVIVPYGTNPTNYISVYVAREGLRINALYDELGCLVPAPRGLSAEELVKRNLLNGLHQKEAIYVTRKRLITKVPTDPFPAGITCDVAEFETKLFSPSALHSTYPNTILSFRSPDGEGNQTFIQFQLNSLYQRLGHQQVLFRGISCVTHFVHSLAVGPYIIPNSCADFGHGLYFTTSFTYAKLYAGEGGCVLVHAWNGPDYCTLREINGDDWNKLVQWNCAHSNVNVILPIPPDYHEDFLSGAVSKDTFGNWECQPPAPTDMQQIVAKTSKAIKMMAEKLIGVICIT